MYERDREKRMEFEKRDLIKKYIKLQIGYPQHKSLFKTLKRKESSRAILIGTPIHGNLGDQLIAKECIKLVYSFGYKTVIEIPEFFYEIFSNKIELLDTDTIFICGGGWMGDLYEDELVIEDVLKKWKDNQIIILPQTIYFGSNKYSSVNQLKNILLKAKNVKLCLREKNSYEFAKTNFESANVKCYLLPDMALLALNHIKSDVEKKPIIYVSLRDDAERILTVDEKKEILTYIQKKEMGIEETSTVIKKKVLPISKREKYINRKIEEFSAGKLVITDRLHTMVFALLSGTPCLAFDNLTHKVSGVADTWLNNITGLKIIDHSDWTGISGAIDELLSIQKIETIHLLEYFDQLKNDLEL